MESKDLIAKIVEQNSNALELILRMEINTKVDADQAKINDNLKKLGLDAYDAASEAQTMAQTAIGQNNALAFSLKEFNKYVENPSESIAMAVGQNTAEFREKLESLDDKINQYPHPDDLITESQVDTMINDSRQDLSDYVKYDDLPDNLEDACKFVEALPDIDDITKTVDNLPLLEAELEKANARITELEKTVEMLKKFAAQSQPDMWLKIWTDDEKPVEKPNDVIIGS